METYTDFYQNFLQECAKKGLQPSKVMTAIGSSAATQSRWMHGVIPRVGMVGKLAEYLGCTPNDLMRPRPNNADNEMSGYIKTLLKSRKHRVLMKLIENATDEQVDKLILEYTQMQVK